MNPVFRSLSVVGLFVAAFHAGCNTKSDAPTMPATAAGSTDTPADAGKHWKRIAFVSHSFTDANTWPLLLRQSLAEANQPLPFLINASAGGDSAQSSRRRYDWAVLRFNPDLVVFFIGSRGNPDAFRAPMEEMITQAQAQGADVMLVTGLLYCPDDMTADDMNDPAKIAAALDKQRTGQDDTTQHAHKGGSADETILRDLAAQYNCIVAELRPAMMDAFEQGHWLWEADHAHINFAANRAVVRAVLDAMGHTNVPVPQAAKLQPLPGLITTWKLRPAAAGEKPLTDDTAAQLAPDDTWTPYTLPEAEPYPASWWEDQVRQEGYAIRLEQAMGKAPYYIGVATYRAKKAGKAYINTGAYVQNIWLNGKEVFRNGGAWDGYHIGTRRIEVNVAEGDNTIVIETGGQFALTVTPELLW